MKRILAFTSVACAFLGSALVFAQVQRDKRIEIVEEKRQELPVERFGKIGERDFLKPAPSRSAAQVAQRRKVLTNHYTNQLLPVFKKELLHARTVCRLTSEELARIRPEADQIFDQVIDQCVEAAQTSTPGKARTRSAMAPAPGLIQSGVLAVVMRHVSPERLESYRLNLERRAANQKQAAMRYLLATLDRELLLSAQQRDKLTESLSSHWDDAWCHAMALNLMGNACIPDIPDELVIAYLSDPQKTSWLGLERNVGGFWVQEIDTMFDPALEKELGGKPGFELVPAPPGKGISVRIAPIPKTP
jgi:hypothetical protein